MSHITALLLASYQPHLAWTRMINFR